MSTIVVQFLTRSAFVVTAPSGLATLGAATCHRELGRWLGRVLPPGEERFRVLFERSPVGMVLAALDGTLIAVNPAACKLWGRREEELIGSSGGDAVHPDERHGATDRFRQLIEGTLDEVRQERRFLRPDGTVIWADSLTQLVRAPDGSPEYLQAVLVDVTERKRAEEALAWLAAIVQSSQDAIVGTTLDGSVISWNAGAERIFGYTATEMIGSSAAVLRPEGSEEETARLTQRIQDNESFENRVVRLRKDASTVTLLSSSTPILDSSGAIVGTATVARDLDEKERADAVFRSLLEAAPDAMVSMDRNGVIALVNAQAERLFGYRRAELIGRPIEALVPDGAAGVDPALRQSYFTDPVPRLMGAGRQLTGRRKDGSEFPAEISLSAIQTQDGTLVSAAIRDGTERWQAAIVASSSDAMIGRGLDGKITSWNAGAERMYGYTAGEAIGNSLSEMFPADNTREMGDLWRRVRRGELVSHFETQRIRKDGERIDESVTMSPIYDAAGAVVGTSAVARDITDSKRAVEALRAVEARKSAILESALDCLITMDHEGLVVEFNPAAERVFGYPRHQVVGQPMHELIIPPAQRDAHRSGLARYLETGEGPLLGKLVELTAVRADGSELPVELSITRVEMLGPPLFTAHLRDITDRKRIESERQALGERLRQSERLESLGQLAGGVAHDFNNLLGVILNYATFVAERTGDDPAAHADVEQIRAAAERGARLTRQLLIVGRRDAIQPAVLDLNAIVADIRDLLSRSIGEHVHLDVRSAEQLPTIRVDRGQIEQVLLNLAVNARDAMPGGGRLTIATQVAELDDDFIRLHPGARAGRHVELSVSDTGMGIAPDVADHIFEPFFTTKPKGQGTGLGLATVYGIVTEAGGSLSVYSEVGMGTTFRVLLPAAEAPAPRAAAPGANRVEGHGETILVVEDEPAMMEVTARILRRSGFVVIEATTGSDAIALVTQGDVDLLLTDSVMPQMSGRELAYRVRQLRPDLPVLFMSGYHEGVVGAQQLVGEGDPLIQKPFNAQALLERVAEVMLGPGPD
jgi:two-component system cell cycle sensor histidine kinase/response regulator CckA